MVAGEYVVTFHIPSSIPSHHFSSSFTPVKQHMPEVPFILVGTQSDLRQGGGDADSRGQAWKNVFMGVEGCWETRTLFKEDRELVPTEAGHAKAQELGAYKYIECSALTGEGLEGKQGVMDEAAQCGLPLALAKKRAQRNSRCVIC